MPLSHQCSIFSMSYPKSHIPHHCTGSWAFVWAPLSHQCSVPSGFMSALSSIPVLPPQWDLGNLFPYWKYGWAPFLVMSVQHLQSYLGVQYNITMENCRDVDTYFFQQPQYDFGTAMQRDSSTMPEKSRTILKDVNSHSTKDLITPWILYNFLTISPVAEFLWVM